MRKKFLVLIVLTIGCLIAPLMAYPKAADSGIKVLFIGNSLTYTNDLPEILKALAKSQNQKFSYKMIALPNYGLLDHWDRKDTRKAIKKGGWDFVVLQQGPTSQADSRKYLIDYAKLFDAEIRAAGGKTALYMVWPDSSRLNFFGDVVDSYKMAADETKSTLLPAGYAWVLAWKRDKTLKLYGSDGFHPSPMGSYLAALVMYQKFYGKSPVGLPRKFNISSFEIGNIDIKPEDAKNLQLAAEEANKAL